MSRFAPVLRSGFWEEENRFTVWARVERAQICTEHYPVGHFLWHKSPQVGSLAANVAPNCRFHHTSPLPQAPERLCWCSVDAPLLQTVTGTERQRNGAHSFKLSSSKQTHKTEQSKASKRRTQSATDTHCVLHYSALFCTAPSLHYSSMHFCTALHCCSTVCIPLCLGPPLPVCGPQSVMDGRPLAIFQPLSLSRSGKKTVDNNTPTLVNNNNNCSSPTLLVSSGNQLQPRCHAHLAFFLFFCSSIFAN